MDSQEQKAYELRLEIESNLYQLLDNGFTVDEVSEWVTGVVDDMREQEELPEDE